METVLLHKSAFLCVTPFFYLSSFGSANALLTGVTKTFVPFYSFFPEIFRKFAPMESTEKLALEEKIVKMLKTVYDPEIPVNVYDLGLIYKIDLDDNACLRLDMTLTAPNCPAADFILEDIRMKLESIEGIKSVDVNLVFEPEWNQDMMTEEAKLELGFL